MVTFYPDMDTIETIFESLLPQVDQVLIVDNGSDRSAMIPILAKNKIHVIWNPKNLGIGEALNQGISYAEKNGFSHVLFLDQDSIPSRNMVLNLVCASERLKQKQPDVVVGPKIMDMQTGRETHFVTFKFPFVRRSHCSDSGKTAIHADFLITSGMLIPVSLFRKTGKMDKRLFIDNVDLEWCFRARKKGVLFYGVCDASLAHSLSDQTIQVWIGRNMTIHWHRSPVRIYYITRNRLWLYSRPYTPVEWIIHDCLRMVIKQLFVIIFFQNRADNIRMFAKGIRDRFTGYLGEYH